MADHDQQFDSAEKSSGIEEISEEQLRLVSELTKRAEPPEYCTIQCSIVVSASYMGMIDTV